MNQKMKTDVLIIGGGVAGVAIARELSQYEVDTLLIEKAPDLSMGISKTAHGYLYTASEMVYSKILKNRGKKKEIRFDDPHTAIIQEGFLLCHDLLHDLDVQHGHSGTVIIARNKEEIPLLEQIQDYANTKAARANNGRPAKLIDQKSLFEIEPNITRSAIGALYDQDCVIDMFPQEFVFALGENARKNGVRMAFGVEATGFSQNGEEQIAKTNKGEITARFIINAAGMSADKIADMAGARDDWEFSFTRHQIAIYDKCLKGFVNNHIRSIPQGGLLNILSPTHEGNLCSSCGPKDVVTDRWNTDTAQESFDLIVKGVKELIPDIPEDAIIANFVGITLSNSRDNHIIEPSKKNNKFINVILRMPGFVAAVPVAQRVSNLLGEQGLKLIKKSNFNSKRQAIPRFRELPDDKKDELISKDPQFGHVICRCETVTEGEIAEAVRRGASTIQGVRFRSRAGMGRCQSNFCGHKLLDALSKNLSQPVEDIVEKDDASRYVL